LCSGVPLLLVQTMAA